MGYVVIILIVVCVLAWGPKQYHPQEERTIIQVSQVRNFQELKKLKGVIAHQGGLGVKANRLSVWSVFFFTKVLA